MPTKRTPRTRFRLGQIHPAVIAYLKDETPPDDPDSRKAIVMATYFQHEGFSKAWDVCRDFIVKEFAEQHPGTRPQAWWEHDAPEPRCRLGGVGTIKSDVLAYGPTYYLGMAWNYLTQWDIDYYQLRLAGKIGPVISEHDMKHIERMKGVAPIDPNDPPTFESQAAYLKRLGLLLAGEEKRLKPADFEPEKVTAE